MDQPSVKRKPVVPETDPKLCIICQKVPGDLVTAPKATSRQNLLDCISERAKYGEPGYLQMNSRISSIDPSELSGLSWHRACYQEAVHTQKIARAKARYEKALATKDATLLTSVKKGRPEARSTGSSPDEPCQSTTRFTRSQAVPHSKDLCLFCNKDGKAKSLHEVSSLIVGKKIREAVEASSNSEWKVRLQPLNPNDARAVDIKYHRDCYVKHVVRQDPGTQGDSKEEHQVQHDAQSEQLISAEIEFINLLQNLFKDGEIHSMNTVCEAYKAILGIYGLEDQNVSNSQVKRKIEENIPDVQFSRPDQRKPEMVCSTATKNSAVAMASQRGNSSKEIQCVFESANIVRRHLLNYQKEGWTFDGSLLPTEDDQGTVPNILVNLLRWIMEGPQTELDLEAIRSDILKKTVHTIAQSIMYEMKTHRQLHHEPKDPSSGFRHSVTKHENATVLAIGLKVHTYTRSKQLVDFLHHCSVSISYPRVLHVEKDLAEAVLKQMQLTGGLYIPPGLQRGKPIFFALDNLDFAEDTPDGKNTLHATMMTVFQQKDLSARHIQNSLRLDKTSTTTKKPLLDEYSSPALLSCDVKGHPSPTQSPKYHFAVDKYNKDVVREHKFEHGVWLLARCTTRTTMNEPSILDTGDASSQAERDLATDECTLRQEVPTWSAYNSIAHKDDRPITGVHVLPLVRAPANEWQTLITVLCHAQNINAIVVGTDRKTIVTLDMDLYARALKLQSLKPDSTKHLVLRIGEFHTVLSALRAIGSIIEDSGIDAAWIEAGIYGPATTRQILEGKHVKRGLEAHTVTLQALFDVLITANVRDISPNLVKHLKAFREACCSCDHERIAEAYESLSSAVENDYSFCSLVDFRNVNVGTPLLQFIRQYMKLVVNLLMFISASRKGLWDLHLASLEELCPLFFSQNRLKYAQHVPEYLAKMYALQHSDPEVWEQFQNGNFCVRKSSVPFTSIGVDHALEQENRKMKIMGGLRGLTQRPGALNRFFLIAPELARLSSEAEEMVGVAKSSHKKHHELNNAIVHRHELNIQKLKVVLQEAEPVLHEETDMVNIVNKTVLPEQAKHDVLRQIEVGLTAYNTFVEERIQGPISLWAPMKKVKLLKWSSSGKTVQTKIGKQVVELKENRSLFARMAIAARSRPDIDMAHVVSTYEMSGVSRSLFAPDGSLLPCNDKSKLLYILESLSPDEDLASPVRSDEDTMFNTTALIVDGMVLVQKLSAKQDEIKTCSDLAASFISLLDKKSRKYNCVHVVFDQYNKESTLKHATRERRKGNHSDNRKYVCLDSTPIRGSLSSFLSNHQTKASLTEYLASKLLAYSKRVGKRLVVSSAQGTRSHQFDVGHLSTNQEEADTIMILHAHFAFRAGFDVHILSPDTDVFILALCHVPELGENISIYAGIGSKQHLVRLKPIHDKLGPKMASALPGFHAFTGCDTTGRFAGKGKLTCWKALEKADQSVVEAFCNLGKSDVPSETDTIGLEKFVCMLYDAKHDSVAKLRWQLFKRHQAEAEKLPPTKDALNFHILRAHYQSMVWNQAFTARPQIPSPDRYGWTNESGTYRPVITVSKPAPEAVLELVRCGCGVGKCKTNACSCRRSSMICSEMCSCEAEEDKCTNVETALEPETTDDEDDNICV